MRNFEDTNPEVKQHLNGESLYVNFIDNPTMKHDNHVVGLVDIGKEGNLYYFEVNGAEVTFREAEGHYVGSPYLVNYYSSRPAKYINDITAKAFKTV